MMLAMVAAVLLSGSDVAAPAPPAPAKPKLVCRDTDRQLGSHIRTGKRCRTAEQWQEEDARRQQLPTTLSVTEGQDGPKRRPQ